MSGRLRRGEKKIITMLFLFYLQISENPPIQKILEVRVVDRGGEI